MNKHLNDRQLLSYLEAVLPAPVPGGDLLPATVPGGDRQREQAEAHLRTCPACRARLDALGRTAADLTATLHAVGEQVPLAPARSWDAIVRRWKRQRPRPYARLSHPLLRHAATLALLVLIVAGLAGLLHTLAVTGPALSRATPTPLPTPTLPTGPSPVPGPLPRPDSDRVAGPVSVLILGTDGESATSDETDALMLFYLDADAGRAFLLSVPRELYVEVPGYGQARAGSLYALGEQDEAQDETTGGLRLAQETISATLRLAVQHAVLVRFDGFVALIDAVGGVDLEVPQPIEDPTFPDGQGGYDPLSVPAGLQHLDGALALRYARTRAVPAPGFDRAFRQRQLAMAVHERVTRLDLLPGLIAQAPALWSSVAGGLETDLTLSDAIDLALMVNNLTPGDVATATLDECCTVPSTTPAGQRVLLPQPDEIEALLEQLLEEGR